MVENFCVENLIHVWNDKRPKVWFSVNCKNFTNIFFPPDILILLTTSFLLKCLQNYYVNHFIYYDAACKWMYLK